VIGGGIIPEQDFQMLYDRGIKAIFTSGTTIDAIVDWVRNNIKANIKQE
jgi:methylmalonyl-CoA mutase C-terminal domain/subunit